MHRKRNLWPKNSSKKASISIDAGPDVDELF